MKYRNVKSGNVIDFYSVVKSPLWEPVAPPKGEEVTATAQDVAVTADATKKRGRRKKVS